MALSAGAAQLRSGLARRPRPEAPAPSNFQAITPLSESATRSLEALISSEIIPRLVLAHSAFTAEPLDVETFAPMTFQGDAAVLLTEVERLLDRGIAVDVIMLDLLAPAARLLGRWWEEDRCSFMEVTIGLWRIQELVRELSRRMPAPLGTRPGRRVLFASFPGEQHDLGAVMLGELFGLNGWNSDTLLGADMPSLLAQSADHHYDVIGLTVSCDCHSDRLRSTIRSLRSVSRNARVRVIVGGRVLNEQPDLAASADADGTATDARGALVLAERLVGAVARDATLRT